MRRWGALLAVALVTLVMASDAYHVNFVNISAQLGLTAAIPNGGSESKDYIIETTGSGIAFIDYDNDGFPDLFVLSGLGGTNRMYHNEDGKRFVDRTEELGLKSSGWAQGACIGDYDNDGFTDLFVTYWGQSKLYRNIHGSRFNDVTAGMNLTQATDRYSTGCAFLDFDNDGRLDLFVANYLKFDYQTTPKRGSNPYCFYRSIPVNCGPRGLPFDRNILYHNAGNRFEDVSVGSGIAQASGHYGLGVLTGDFNDDGLTDIYVACDQTPSLLYINKGSGRFEEDGVVRGVAFDQNGKAMSGMGLTAADIFGDGRLSIFRTNFSDEFETLYRNVGRGNFDDVTLSSGLGKNTRFVGWGTAFFDFDNDGWQDLILVNGHAFPEVERLHLDVHYRDRAILYRNQGQGIFQDVSETSGPAILERHSSRGLAVADYNNDGVLEVAVNNQNERVSFLSQAQRPPGHWLEVQLVGTKSNRSAIGARVRIRTGVHEQLEEVRSGGSYLSQNDLRLHFGLGSNRVVDEIKVLWPTGREQRILNQAGDQILVIREP